MDIAADDLFIDSDVQQKLRRCLEDILNGNCPLYPVLRAIFGNNLRMLERLMGHTFVNVKHLDGLSATAQFPETGSKVFENCLRQFSMHTLGNFVVSLIRNDCEAFTKDVLATGATPLKNPLLSNSLDDATRTYAEDSDAQKPLNMK